MSVALITGASSGIGLATTRLLALQGLTVVGVSRSGREGTLPIDVSTERGCDEAVHAARSEGQLTRLVLAAGVGSYMETDIGTQTTESWRTSMAIHLDSPFFTIRAAWPDLKEHGGRIVLVSSTAATSGAPANSAYSAAKAGILGMMRSIAQDGAPYGITCNAVLPGWVRSEMSEAHAAVDAERLGVSVDQIWAERAAEYAAGRVVEADEVAAAIAFFCSEQSSGISGEEVRVALGGAW